MKVANGSSGHAMHEMEHSTRTRPETDPRVEWWRQAGRGSGGRRRRLGSFFPRSAAGEWMELGFEIR